MQALYNPEVVLLGTYPREMKLEVHTKICTQVFRVALLVIALFINWKQPRCPLTGEWLNKVWYSHMKKYCSAIKRKELLI